MISLLFLLMWRTPDKNNLRKGLFRLTVQEHSQLWGSHGDRCLRYLVTSHPQHKQKNDNAQLTSSFPLSPGLQPMELCHLVCGGLPISANLTQKLAHRHAKTLVSWAILDPVSWQSILIITPTCIYLLCKHFVMEIRIFSY